MSFLIADIMESLHQAETSVLIGELQPQRLTTFVLGGNLHATHLGSPLHPDSPPPLVASSALFKGTAPPL
jgi:hypothetical protein